MPRITVGDEDTWKHPGTHHCVPPTSSDFRDGAEAEGCWGEGLLHYQQVCGQSGVYLVVTEAWSGRVVRDDRPWQMRV